MCKKQLQWNKQYDIQIKLIQYLVELANLLVNNTETPQPYITFLRQIKVFALIAIAVNLLTIKRLIWTSDQVDTGYFLFSLIKSLYPFHTCYGGVILIVSFSM